MNNFICKECCKEFGAENFYYRKDGSRISKCKKCYTLHVDDYQPKTFLSLMKDMDIPFIIEEWYRLRENFEKKHNGLEYYQTIFGIYLSKMKLRGYQCFGYEDSHALNYCNYCNYRAKQALEEEKLNYLKEQAAKEEEVTYNAQIILRKM